MADGENPEIIRHIGRYIASVSRASLSSRDQKASIERIREMLFCNTRLSLGEPSAERALCFAEKIPILNSCPAYGDGRLAPHEWVRADDGRILKLDAMGHDSDHTIVGRQPIYWDAAGAMVEWRLRSSQPLLSAMGREGIMLNQHVLTFYEMAYAAFRLGQASLCMDVCAGDAGERARFQSAVAEYKNHLSRLLENA